VVIVTGADFHVAARARAGIDDVASELAVSLKLAQERAENIIRVRPK